MTDEVVTPPVPAGNVQVNDQGQSSPAARAEVSKPAAVDSPVVPAPAAPEDYGRAHPEAWPGPPPKLD